MVFRHLLKENHVKFIFLKKLIIKIFHGQFLGDSSANLTKWSQKRSKVNDKISPYPPSYRYMRHLPPTPNKGDFVISVICGGIYLLG